MEPTEMILGTDEAWEAGHLGNDESHAVALSAEEQRIDNARIEESLGLHMISIRLERALIEDFKMIAELNGIGYQPLMRQALKRFADCEKKKILTDAYNAMKERQGAPQDADKPHFGGDDGQDKIAA